jgi:hypothetical protein
VGFARKLESLVARPFPFARWHLALFRQEPTVFASMVSEVRVCCGIRLSVFLIRSATEIPSCNLSAFTHHRLAMRHGTGPDWESVSAGRRIGVSASGEVKLLFDTPLVTGPDEVDDALQTPTRRHADTPTRFSLPPAKYMLFRGTGH